MALRHPPLGVNAKRAEILQILQAAELAVLEVEAKSRDR